ncbi:PfkB family carbohydrate kinase [uncultured Aliiroseovarius sp.]|uniref:carbohydrate kinase family protein n=1 Tax=uncultured Aliiroseovarius sp. TaxID=1658783 RepID=UPI002592AFBB|nr:PfkB family carbohydrate kinase [uncultured Aliiroseovarius sp.]
MKAQLDILSAGRIYADLILAGLDADPAPGREVYAKQFVLVPGGGAFITGAYAAALGSRTGLYGLLPAPPFDTCIREGIAAAGLVAHVAPAPAGSDPQLTVAITGTHDRSFITRRPGRALPDGPLPAASHLHVGELATALEQPDLIAQARQAGMSVSLDCGWDAAALADPRVPRIVAEVDLFLPNAEEAAQLAMHGHRLSPRHALVVKRAAEGATAQVDNQDYSVTAPQVSVVDATGAGDAFNAGFVTAWLSGANTQDCLAAGVACGAKAVTRIGGATDLGRLDLRAEPPAKTHDKLH